MSKSDKLPISRRKLLKKGGQIALTAGSIGFGIKMFFGGQPVSAGDRRAVCGTCGCPCTCSASAGILENAKMNYKVGYMAGLTKGKGKNIKISPM